MSCRGGICGTFGQAARRAQCPTGVDIVEDQFCSVRSPVGGRKSSGNLTHAPVLTNGEHALEARDKGLMGMLLRYPYEVRDAAEYFNDIQDVKITKDMLDLAKHIVETKAGHFEPAKFQDHYESALQELEKKQKGQPIVAAKKATPTNVYNLMDALRASIKGGQPMARKDRRRQPQESKSAKLASKRKAG